MVGAEYLFTLEDAVVWYCSVFYQLLGDQGVVDPACGCGINVLQHTFNVCLRGVLPGEDFLVGISKFVLIAECC